MYTRPYCIALHNRLKTNTVHLKRQCKKVCNVAPTLGKLLHNAYMNMSSPISATGLILITTCAYARATGAGIQLRSTSGAVAHKMYTKRHLMPFDPLTSLHIRSASLSQRAFLHTHHLKAATLHAQPRSPASATAAARCASCARLPVS